MTHSNPKMMSYMLFTKADKKDDKNVREQRLQVNDVVSQNTSGEDRRGMRMGHDRTGEDRDDRRGEDQKTGI